MVRAVADNKHQGHAADHADGFAAPARLFRQMVVLGYKLEFETQDRVTHKDGHDRDDITKEDGTNQYSGNMIDHLEVGVFHTGDVAISFLVAHGHVQQREGLSQDQQPHGDTNVAHFADLPEFGEAQRHDHSNETVNAKAGHEIDPGVGVDVEDEA